MFIGIRMNMQGSRTEKNLLAAFAGESQARIRYSFFASVAKKEGFEQISGIFQETSDNEREHAQQLLVFARDHAEPDIVWRQPMVQVGCNPGI